jgi:hypothetical protein
MSARATDDASSLSVHGPANAEAARAATAWTGSYKSAPGGLYIPPDWKNVRFVVKDTEAGLGEGALSFRVDPPSSGVGGGRVLGTLDGPLGPATIDGRAQDGKVTATIFRKDPTDQGFAGTLIGAMAGDRGEGTLNVSLGDANAIRRATFAVKQDRAAR